MALLSHENILWKIWLMELINKQFIYLSAEQTMQKFNDLYDSLNQSSHIGFFSSCYICQINGIQYAFVNKAKDFMTAYWALEDKNCFVSKACILRGLLELYAVSARIFEIYEKHNISSFDETIAKMKNFFVPHMDKKHKKTNILTHIHKANQIFHKDKNNCNCIIETYDMLSGMAHPNMEGTLFSCLEENELLNRFGLEKIIQPNNMKNYHMMLFLFCLRNIYTVLMQLEEWKNNLIQAAEYHQN
ncbi:MAG: hypothetical protein AAF669_02865 [Pseudomonadota bacterium]